MANKDAILLRSPCSMARLEPWFEPIQPRFLKAPESFRENVAEDANTAIGFFDVFVGLEPEWQIPDSFRLRLDRALIARKNAERLSA